MPDITRLAVVVEAQTQKASSDLSQVGAQADTLGKKRATVRVDSDIRQALVQLGQLEQHMSGLGRRSGFVKVGADVNPAMAALQGLERQVGMLATRAPAVKVSADVSVATQQVASLSGGLQRASQDATGLGTSLKQALGVGAGFGVATAAIGGIASAVGAAKDSIVGFNSTLEQSRVGFTTMLGSADKAQAMLGQLQKFAASTPFTFPELLESSKRMLGMGFAAESVIPMLRSIGNAVAAVGGSSAQVNQVTLALGQMLAKGKVSAEEINQLAERGIPGWEILAQAMGKSKAEVIKLAEQGAIASEVFLNAFQKFSDARFGDMMAAQSQTFQGAMSNISDGLQNLVANSFEPLFNVVRDAAVALANFLTSDKAMAFAADLKATIQDVTNAFTPLREAFARIGGEFQAGGITRGLTSIRDEIMGFAEGMFGAGVHVVTEFAGGIISGAGSLIADAANAVAEIIASFLVGSSPPPTGPLSQIDTAGRTLMETYVTGMGGGLSELAGVAQGVVDAFGNVDKTLTLAEGQAALKAAAGNLAALKAAGEDVEGALRSIDGLLRANEMATRDLKFAADGIKESYEAQIAPLEAQVAAIERSAEASKVSQEAVSSLKFLAEDLRGAYESQIDPLEAQLNAIKGVVDFEERRLDLADKIRSAELNQAALAAQGDPVQRAKLQAQIDTVNEHQKDLSLQAKEQQILRQIEEQEKKRADAKKSGKDFNDRDFDTQLALLQSQKEEAALQRQMAGLVDKEGAARVKAEQAALKASGDARNIEQDRIKLQREMAALPLEQKIAQLKTEEQATLAPILAQIQAMERQNQLIDIQTKAQTGPLKQAIVDQKADLEATLAPLNEQIKLSEREHQVLQAQRQQWALLKADITDAVGEQGKMETEAKKAAKGASGSEFAPGNAKLNLQTIDLGGTVADAGKKAGESFLGGMREHVSANAATLIGGAVGGALGGAAFGPLGLVAGALFGSKLAEGIKARLPDMEAVAGNLVGKLSDALNVDTSKATNPAEAVAVVWEQTSERIRAAAETALGKVTDFLGIDTGPATNLTEALALAWDGLQARIATAVDDGLTEVGRFFGIDTSGASGPVEKIATIWAGLVPKIGQVVTDTLDTLAGLAGVDTKNIEGAWGKIVVIAIAIKDGVVKAFTDIKTQLESVQFNENLSQAGKNIAEAWSLVKGIVEPAAKLLLGIDLNPAATSANSAAGGMTAFGSAVQETGKIIRGVSAFIVGTVDVIDTLGKTIGNTSLAIAAGVRVLGNALASGGKLAVGDFAGANAAADAAADQRAEMARLKQQNADLWAGLQERAQLRKAAGMQEVQATDLAGQAVARETEEMYTQQLRTIDAAVPKVESASADVGIALPTGVTEGIVQGRPVVTGAIDTTTTTMAQTWATGHAEILDADTTGWQAVHQETTTSLVAIHALVGAKGTEIVAQWQVTMLAPLDVANADGWAIVHEGTTVSLDAIWALVGDKGAEIVAQWQVTFLVPLAEANLQGWQVVHEGTDTSINDIHSLLGSKGAELAGQWTIAAMAPIQQTNVLGWQTVHKDTDDSLNQIHALIGSKGGELAAQMGLVMAAMNQVVATGVQQMVQTMSNGMSQMQAAQSSSMRTMGTGGLQTLSTGGGKAGVSAANGSPLANKIYAAAGRQGIDPKAYYAQLQQESGNFSEDVLRGDRRSSAGARGIAQFMPDTAKAMAAKLNVTIDQFWASIDLQVEAGAMYLKEQVDRFGSFEDALRAYNAGPNAVEASRSYKETNDYVAIINRNKANAPDIVAPGAAAAGGGGMIPTKPQRQFEIEAGLSEAAAYSACGPVAATMFANAVGRMPNAKEATDLARKFGWVPGQGMTNASQFDEYTNALIDQMGGSGRRAVQDVTPTLGEAAGAIQGGSPVAFSTAGAKGHYFGATDYDPTSKKFNVGASGKVFAGGSEWMTIEEMEAVSGKLISITTLVERVGTTFAATGQQADNAISGIGGLMGPATQGIQDQSQQTDAWAASLAGLAPAGLTATGVVGTMAAEARNLLPVVASGAVGTDQLGLMLVKLAERAGVTAAPLAGLRDGTLTVEQASAALLTELAKQDPAFAAIKQSMIATGGQAQAMGQQLTTGVTSALMSGVPAVQTFGQNVTGLAAQFNAGSITADQFARGLAESASAAGLTQAPLEALEAGTIGSEQAFLLISKALATADPQFAALTTQLQQTAIGGGAAQAVLQGFGDATGSAGAAVAQMQGNLAPLIQGVAEGSVGTQELEQKIVGLASATGLVSPNIAAMAGTVEGAGVAMTEVIAKSAALGGGFAALDQQLKDGVISTDDAARAYLELVKGYQAVPAAADAATKGTEAVEGATVAATEVVTGQAATVTTANAEIVASNATMAAQSAAAHDAVTAAIQREIEQVNALLGVMSPLNEQIATANGLLETMRAGFEAAGQAAGAAVEPIGQYAEAVSKLDTGPIEAQASAWDSVRSAADSARSAAEAAASAASDIPDAGSGSGRSSRSSGAGGSSRSSGGSARKGTTSMTKKKSTSSGSRSTNSGGRTGSGGGGSGGGDESGAIYAALGGPVLKDGLYIVGEDGPEFFVPDLPGRIIPADETADLLESLERYGVQYLATGGRTTKKATGAKSGSSSRGGSGKKDQTGNSRRSGSKGKAGLKGAKGKAGSKDGKDKQKEKDATKEITALEKTILDLKVRQSQAELAALPTRQKLSAAEEAIADAAERALNGTLDQPGPNAQIAHLKAKQAEAALNALPVVQEIERTEARIAATLKGSLVEQQRIHAIGVERLKIEAQQIPIQASIRKHDSKISDLEEKKTNIGKRVRAKYAPQTSKLEARIERAQLPLAKNERDIVASQQNVNRLEAKHSNILAGKIGARLRLISIATKRARIRQQELAIENQIREVTKSTLDLDTKLAPLMQQRLGPADTLAATQTKIADVEEEIRQKTEGTIAAASRRVTVEVRQAALQQEALGLEAAIEAATISAVSQEARQLKLRQEELGLQQQVEAITVSTAALERQQLGRRVDELDLQRQIAAVTQSTAAIDERLAGLQIQTAQATLDDLPHRVQIRDVQRQIEDSERASLAAQLAAIDAETKRAGVDLRNLELQRKLKEVELGLEKGLSQTQINALWDQKTQVEGEAELLGIDQQIADLRKQIAGAESQKLLTSLEEEQRLRDLSLQTVTDQVDMLGAQKAVIDATNAAATAGYQARLDALGREQAALSLEVEIIKAGNAVATAGYQARLDAIGKEQTALSLQTDLIDAANTAATAGYQARLDVIGKEQTALQRSLDLDRLAGEVAAADAKQRLASLQDTERAQARQLQTIDNQIEAINRQKAAVEAANAVATAGLNAQIAALQRQDAELAAQAEKIELNNQIKAAGSAKELERASESHRILVKQNAAITSRIALDEADLKLINVRIRQEEAELAGPVEALITAHLTKKHLLELQNQKLTEQAEKLDTESRLIALNNSLAAAADQTHLIELQAQKGVHDLIASSISQSLDKNTVAATVITTQKDAELLKLGVLRDQNNVLDSTLKKLNDELALLNAQKGVVDATNAAKAAGASIAVPAATGAVAGAPTFTGAAATLALAAEPIGGGRVTLADGTRTDYARGTLATLPDGTQISFSTGSGGFIRNAAGAVIGQYPAGATQVPLPGGGHVRFLARGGRARAGEQAIVGEEGPELVRFRRDAVVIPSDDTRRYLADDRPSEVHHHYTANVENHTHRPTESPAATVRLVKVAIREAVGMAG